MIFRFLRVWLAYFRLWSKNNALNKNQQLGRYSFLGFLFRAFLLVVFASIIIFPFYFMISTSLLSESNSLRLQDGEQIFFPNPVQYDNYVTAATVSDINQVYTGALFASIVTTIVSVLTRLFFTLSFGYAFSLPNWRFKRLSWMFFLLLITIPESGILLGQFAIVQKTFLKNTLIWVGLTIPFVTSVFSGYMFKNAFESIPPQIREATALDGASNFEYLFKVAIPMIRPVIWTVVIITSFGAWTSYFWPNMILGSDTAAWQPLSLWVFNAGNLPGVEERRFLISVRLAAAVLAIIPMFVVYFLFRERIMRAITQQGAIIKG